MDASLYQGIVIGVVGSILILIAYEAKFGGRDDD